MQEKDYEGDITEQWGHDPVVNLRFGPVRKAFDEDPLVVSRKVSPFRVFRTDLRFNGKTPTCRGCQGVYL